ncbi:MAG: hypothetical protein ACXU82_06130 [Caulobacteraceae bacterium]
MKLNYAPQAGLRRRKPDQPREKLAFWGGILILCAFELVLMSKSWSPDSAARIFDFHAEQAQAADADQASVEN